MYFCELLLVAGFASETEVETFFTREKSQIALGAVVFDRKSFVGDKIRSDATITYKIRLRSEDYNGKNQHAWLTSLTFPAGPGVSPQGDMYGLEEPGILTRSLSSSTSFICSLSKTVQCEQNTALLAACEQI